MAEPLISFVIPAKDEEGSIRQLFDEIVAAVADVGCEFEVIFIDDGSSDGTWRVLESLAAQSNSRVTAIRFRRNFGKALALRAGFERARGSIVITMDADGQDDPSEIPNFLAKLDQGFDLVSGWKEVRRDPLSKRLPSKVFNWVTATLSGVELRDINCGFKAYRHEVIEQLNLYGELHRYIPVLALDLGYRIGEIPVHHRKREHGASKYGWERYARGFLDLLAAVAITRYLQCPGHFFGGLGLITGAMGVVTLGYQAARWILADAGMMMQPPLLIGLLLVAVCIQLISIGILGEMVVRRFNGRPTAALIADEVGTTDRSGLVP